MGRRLDRLWKTPEKRGDRHMRGLMASMAVSLLVSVALATAAQAQDADGDGILDGVDNCVLVPNANQHNSDADAFGNMCDADYNNDTLVDGLDFMNFFLPAIGPVAAGNDVDCCDAPGPPAWAAKSGS